jgi:ribosomal protein S18 acetylase RimI-like enzyme
MPEIIYAHESSLAVDEFIGLLHRSTLAERRPVGELNTLEAMIANAQVIVTARDDGLLVGISRAITDFAYCTYLSDLAVDTRYQRQGIGRELIRRTHDLAGRGTTLILLSAPQAVDYYPHIGMRKHDSCWVLDREHSETSESGRE